MTQRPLESLGALVRTKRDQRKLRETANEIGIGAATLLRVESGRIPDVATFGKLCIWLQIDPGVFLGFEPRSKTQQENDVLSPGTQVFSAHFKTPKLLQRNTVEALANLLFLAAKMQPGEPEV